jgi:hypothetical protein
MKNPMSNVVFGMAAATLSNRNIRDIISNAPALSKVIEISLKPSRRLYVVDSLDINLA